MKKIGIVNIDTSHPLSFAEIMANNPDLDMQYTKIYNDGFREADEVDWFKEKYNMDPLAKTVKELADNTDVGFIQGCNWDKHIDYALPFIELGKPVFMDKPMVGSVSDVKRIRELVKNGAKIIGSSSARYAEEIQNFLALPIEERGEVVAVYAESGVDEFNYGVHVGEIISEIAGAKAVSCKFIGKSKKEGADCEFFQATFENGVIGTYCTYLSGWRTFNISIITTKTSYVFKIDSTKIYLELLKRLSDYLKTGEGPVADTEKILNVTEFMLCGKKSRDEENGKEVFISDLTDNDSFDGDAFEAFYSQGSKIYKNRNK